MRFDHICYKKVIICPWSTSLLIVKEKNEIRLSRYILYELLCSPIDPCHFDAYKLLMKYPVLQFCLYSPECFAGSLYLPWTTIHFINEYCTLSSGKSFSLMGRESRVKSCLLFIKRSVIGCWKRAYFLWSSCADHNFKMPFYFLCMRRCEK
jgi:hypothetical protein